MAEHFMTGISKEGSVIFITLHDRPSPIKYDCNTGKLTSFTGRTVKYFPQSCIIGDVNGAEHWAITVVCEKIKNGYSCDFPILEKFITALDLVENPDTLPYECPKGYIKWLRDNGKYASSDTLKEFYSEQNLNKLSKEDRDVYEKLCTGFSLTGCLMAWWVEEKNTTLRQKFRQMFQATIKSFTWNMHEDLYSWYSFFIETKNGEKVWGNNWVDFLDGNRDFRYNIKTCEEQRDKERNAKILANENKIRSITEIQHDDFVIVVPSKMDDFIKEGKMQNNCVGSYYHDSIAEGDSLIYFIRKRKNPHRSYITNRYSTNCRKTFETRMINNRGNDDSKALELIEIIDKKIAELLEN